MVQELKYLQRIRKSNRKGSCRLITKAAALPCVCHYYHKKDIYHYQRQSKLRMMHGKRCIDHSISLRRIQLSMDMH